MKNIALIILLFLSLNSYCQLKLVNKDLIKKDSAVLYIGIMNHLYIVGQQDISKYNITTTGSEIRIDNNIILLSPSKPGFDTLRIYANKKLISTNIFRVERFKNPVAQLAFTLDSVITMNRILANPYLSVKVPGSLDNIDYNIVAFECSLQKANSNNYIFNGEVQGNKLTDHLLNYIKKMNSGDRIIFDDIKTLGPGGDIRKLPPFTVTIK